MIQCNQTCAECNKRLNEGEFRSVGRRVFRIEGSVLDIPFSVEHHVDYEECDFSQLGNTTVLKLRVGRNFVTYDAREQIVRYAMTSKISPLEGWSCSRISFKSVSLLNAI